MDKGDVVKVLKLPPQLWMAFMEAVISVEIISNDNDTYTVRIKENGDVCDKQFVSATYAASWANGQKSRLGLSMNSDHELMAKDREPAVFLKS